MQLTEPKTSARTPERSHPRAFSSPRRLSRGGRRAVSEVIGTILILALTVVLFSAIFYFVSTLPPPPSSSTSQFSAVLGIGGGTSPGESDINITYQAGPTLVSATTAIYLSSTVNAANYNCARSGSYGNPYTVSQGLAGAPNIWTAGQIWTLHLQVGATVCPGGALSAAGDNVTISIVDTAKNTLLFHVTLPGTTPNIP
ncbi:MAG: type IV pilin N-terminal domain-containing protein, partial [Euryarchaeota archaeon]|nr:type IV pilin N-terminal domain-containing protein [Euryarchaeota archaeon]